MTDQINFGPLGDAIARAMNAQTELLFILAMNDICNQILSIRCSYGGNELPHAARDLSEDARKAIDDVLDEITKDGVIALGDWDD